MPLWAWVVTARMSNILNFSWYFLCIPAIYRCILAYLPIFFNQLSKFLRCESPSTFLGTCLSHHYFIIFLVTNTNTLLSGLYLISTAKEVLTNNLEVKECQCPLRLIPHFYIWKLSSISLSSRARCQCPLGLIPHFYDITFFIDDYSSEKCQCPLGLIPHFYNQATSVRRWNRHNVSMPSRAYTSFLPGMSGRKDIFIECQCPLGLIPHFYGTLQKPRFYAVSRACFCRYLSEYSDNSRFSCMLTFWTYLMRCTYPWHWIKYSTNYNRCHPIFSLSW